MSKYSNAPTEQIQERRRRVRASPNKIRDSAQAATTEHIAAPQRRRRHLQLRNCYDGEDQSRRVLCVYMYLTEALKSNRGI